ncbi:MAG: NAD(P)H-dependent oxidoreductase [Synoicihabitans sp.]
MTPVSNAQLLEALNWRYATKQFDSARKIEDGIWQTLEEALILAPSSFGLQPWKFVVVKDEAVKDQLVAASWNQTQPRDCSHFVVLAVKRDIGDDHLDRYMARTAEVRGTSVESMTPFRNVIKGSLDAARKEGRLDVWQTHQIYIALGQFMAAAALVGVDTCPMEGIVPVKYDEILGLEGTGWATVVACAAGYRSENDKYATRPKVRFPTEEVIEYR